jgi:RNA 2',3'-cyclic 3'-phosphodiesterase
VRLFVGVELDDGVRSAAAAAAETLRDRLVRIAPGLDARWISPPNLHITLWFIGEVDDERAAAIQGALGPRFDTPVFTLAVAGCGAFPPSGPPRVIWFGVTDGAGSMVDLYRDVARRLVPLGFEAERRPYSPHLTIARVKDMPRSSSRTFREMLADTAADLGSCRIGNVTLFRSRLSPKGANYEPLVRVPLS